MMNQTNTDLSKIQNYAPKVKGYHKSENVRLTSRDLDMLEFMNDMKFASVAEIHERFFLRKGEDRNKPSTAARNRLTSLIFGGFLKGERCGPMGQAFYIVTEKGHTALNNFKPMREHPAPMRGIDKSTFDHDYRVLLTRVFFERNNLLTSWISERQMICEKSLVEGLHEEYHPDAIMVLPDGKRVAYEFENAWKSKDRYQKKINKFLDVMNSDGRKSFDVVHYLCMKSGVANSLKTLTSAFEDQFIVHEGKEFFKHYMPNGEMPPSPQVMASAQGELEANVG